MRGHELDGVLRLAVLQSHRRSQEGFPRYCVVVPGASDLSDVLAYY